jgi:hypothetical protein
MRIAAFGAGHSVAKVGPLEPGGSHTVLMLTTTSVRSHGPRPVMHGQALNPSSGKWSLEDSAAPVAAMIVGSQSVT